MVTYRSRHSAIYCEYILKVKVKVKCSRYGPGVGRCITLLFHDRGTRRGWVDSSTPRPHITPGKTPAPILQEVGWAPGPVWTGGKSRPYRDSIPDRPARGQSLYRLSYQAHGIYTLTYFGINYIKQWGLLEVPYEYCPNYEYQYLTCLFNDRLIPLHFPRLHGEESFVRS